MNESLPSALIPCPFLPVPDREYHASDITRFGNERSIAFYNVALHYAQTHWLTGFPAKALLLINRALSCYLPEVSLLVEEKPYHAVAWILKNRPEDRFIGNPRRHYQHLATRMVEPHKELRVWRAWACWYLAKAILPKLDYPSDTKQIREEGIVEPRKQDIAEKLKELSPSDDLAAWEAALAWAKPTPPIQQAASHVRLISVEELPMIRSLALDIWPKVYPGIISVAQIHYMLDEFYTLEVLRQEIVVRGVVYALLEQDREPIGYLSFEEVPNDQSMFLHKLYLKAELHDQGMGAKALQWLVLEGQRRHLTAIRLRVNKNNHRAIRSYLREGFRITHDLCSDSGNGYAMDDHVMCKAL